MTEINHRYLVDKEGETYFPVTHKDAVIGLEDIESNQQLKSPLENKTIVTFGDSITDLGNYPETIEENTGATIVKAGFSGCRMTEHTGNSLLNNMSMQKLSEFIKANDFSQLVTAAQQYYENGGRDHRGTAERLSSTNWNSVDIITILFGTNDFTNQASLGNNSDMTGTTFKGAINKTIKNINEALPHVRIMFVTPIFMSRMYSTEGENSDDYPNKDGIYFKEFINSIKDLSEMSHVPVINLNALSGINKYNSGSFLSDGKHLNGEGSSRLARVIGNQVGLLY